MAFAARLDFASQVAIPAVGALRRQCHRQSQRNALVHRSGAACASRSGGRRHGAGRQAVPPAGAVGQPPRPGFPRLFRHHRRRAHQARRDGGRRQVGQDQQGRPHRHHGRRFARSGGGRRGDPDLDRRGRYLARRRPGRSACASDRLRPVRGASAVDGGGGTAAGAPVSSQAGHRHRARPGHRPQAQDRRQHVWTIMPPRPWS